MDIAGTLTLMWLDELRHENRLSRSSFQERVAPSDTPRKDTGFTREELTRLADKTLELRQELATTVRRIDPVEYTDERIQELLNQVRKNKNNKGAR